MKTIIFTNAADRQLSALPVTAQEQVIEALGRYAISGVGDVKRLAGRMGYRLRVGRYRVIFDEDEVTVLTIYVGKRDSTTYGRH